MNIKDSHPGLTVNPEANLSPERKWKDRLNATIIALEVSPVNEIGRFGALAVAMALSGSDPAVSAIAIGGATVAFEVPAAFASADVLDNNERLRHSIDGVNRFTGRLREKFGIAADTKASVPTKIGLAYFGGSAVSTLIKHKEDTSRTKEQNRRYGLGVAGALSGVSALQGYLVASGVQYPSPDRVATAALTVGAAIGAAKIFKGWVRHENSNLEDKESQYLIEEEA